MGLNWNEIKSRALLFNKPWANATNEDSETKPVGFGKDDSINRTIFECVNIQGETHVIPAKQINPYLVDAPSVLLRKRTNPIYSIPRINYGSMPNDGDHQLLTDTEKQALVHSTPNAPAWLKPFFMVEAFINNTKRWCLWLVDCPPSLLKSIPEVLARVNAVRKTRLLSTRETTRALANAPTIFREIRQPKSLRYVAIPIVSAERTLMRIIPCSTASKERTC
jgi:hypothetical protein